MTAHFAGFPERMTYVPIPGPFFGPLLRDIDSLIELKLALHVCRRLYEGRGTPRYVRRSELLADRGLMAALRPGASTPNDAEVAGALGAAVRRGMLLAVAVRAGDDDDVCYLLNTPTNARVADAVARGDVLGAAGADDRLPKVRVAGRHVAAQEAGPAAARTDRCLLGRWLSGGRAGRTDLRQTVADPQSDQGVAQSLHVSPSLGASALG